MFGSKCEPLDMCNELTTYQAPGPGARTWRRAWRRASSHLEPSWRCPWRFLGRLGTVLRASCVPTWVPTFSPVSFNTCINSTLSYAQDYRVCPSASLAPQIHPISSVSQYMYREYTLLCKGLCPILRFPVHPAHRNVSFIYYFVSSAAQTIRL